MINVPNYENVTNAVPKNKKCWIAVVENVPGVGKIFRK